MTSADCSKRRSPLDKEIRSLLPLVHRNRMTDLAPAARSGKRYLNPAPTAVGDAKTFLAASYKYFTHREQRSPPQALGPFPTDASVYMQPPASGLRVAWLGHSSSLLEIDGARILVDPLWEPRASSVNWLGPRRFFAPPLAIEALPPVDVVLISHDHYDHLGAATVRLLGQSSSCRAAQWVTPRGVGPLLRRFGAPADRIHELNWTEGVEIGPLTLTALPARHFSGRGLFNRFQTLWASFAIQTARHRIFYGADSGEWAGFAEIGRRFGPFDLSLLEIGASDPPWRDIHMGPDGAVRTFQSMGGQGLLMPIHWGLFDLALHHWQQPIERLFAAENVKLWAPEPGRPTEVLPNTELRSEWWR